MGEKPTASGGRARNVGMFFSEPEAMANHRAGFTQSDVTRALKGIAAAGLDPREFAVMILPSGEFRIEPFVAAGEARGIANSVDRIRHGKG